MRRHHICCRAVFTVMNFTQSSTIQRMGFESPDVRHFLPYSHHALHASTGHTERLPMQPGVAACRGRGSHTDLCPNLIRSQMKSSLRPVREKFACLKFIGFTLNTSGHEIFTARMRNLPNCRRHTDRLSRIGIMPLGASTGLYRLRIGRMRGIFQRSRRRHLRSRRVHNFPFVGYPHIYPVRTGSADRDICA